MDGMKSGSGDDPFAEDDSGGGDERDASEDRDDTAQTTGENPDRTAIDPAPSGLPWIYSRNNAKSQREMVQFFLQSDTQTLESEAQDDLESMLGEEPLVLDLREAAYRVALEQHLADIADQLREWGYDAD